VRASGLGPGFTGGLLAEIGPFIASVFRGA